MESDKFGTLVQLRAFTSKLTKTEDFGLLLNEFTKVIGNEIMHKIVYSGFYKYYRLLQAQQIRNLMSITLTHYEKINANGGHEKETSADDIKDAKHDIINQIIPSLSTETLQTLSKTRQIQLFATNSDNSYRSQLISALTNNMKQCNIQSIRHYNTYSKLNQNELLAECKLFNLKINNCDENEIRGKLYAYLNDKLFAIRLTDLQADVISSVCTFLDIKSLLRFELCNRLICVEARRPSSCVAFDTSPASPNGSQFAFAHYIASNYSQFCKRGIVPDTHRFVNTKEWNITLNPCNKCEFDPTSSTGSRYVHCIMRTFMDTAFQKRLLSLSVNLGQIQLDPGVPFPYHENLKTLNCIQIHPQDILRVFTNYPSHKFITLSFTELVLCNFQTISDQSNYENFYRFLHVLLPKWNKYYPSNELLKLTYYPGETNLLAKFENLVKKPPVFINLVFEKIFDGELTSVKPEFAMEVAKIFNDLNVLKNCIEPTLAGYVCHTSNNTSCNILTYFTLSILKNCGNILNSLHFQSDEFNFDYYGYNEHNNKILIKLNNLQELCLLFKDDTIISFIDIESLNKLKHIFFKIDTIDTIKISNFLQILMNKCSKLTFCMISVNVHNFGNNCNHINNSSKLTEKFFCMIQSSMNQQIEKEKFILKICVNINDHNASGLQFINLTIANKIKLILNSLYTQCKESIFLIKFQFPTNTRNIKNKNNNNNILNQFIFNDQQIIHEQQWKICKETYNQCIVWAFVTPNCSINGYSTKWKCNCVICHDKLPWFW